MMTFREALLFWIEKRNLSLRQVSEGSQVSYEQLKKLKQIDTRTTNFDDGVKVSRFFHLSVEDFLAGEENSGRDSIVGVLEALSPAAREVLENAAHAQLAAEAEKSAKSGADE